MADKRSRSWVFTYFNYTDEDEVRLQSLEGLKWLFYGHEKCPSTGRPHLQGAIVFTTLKSRKQIGKVIINNWYERMVGEPSENVKYCSKEMDNVIEVGTRPMDSTEKGLSEKERWAAARKAACLGKMDEIPDDIFMRHYSNCKAIAKDYMPKIPNLDDVCGVWYWGVPGSGKSHSAREDFPDHFTKGCGKWWDGYQNEAAVIIDDLEVDSAKYNMAHYLKTWADKYSFKAETKGGAFNIRPKHIVVTSNYSIEDIFGADPVCCKAIRRRFDVTYFHQEYKKDMQLELNINHAQTQDVSKEIEAPQEEQKSPYQETIDNANFQKGHTGFYGR